MLRLRESGHDPALQQQCAHWRSSHHENEQAWQRVVHLHQDLDLRAIPGAGLALQTLETSQQRLRRRQALKLLGGVVMAGSASWLAKDLDTVSAWTSDYATGTGERRVFTLPDGSLMQLNTCSAVDLAFHDQQRLVRLKHGELMINCNPRNPLLVQTRDALLEGFEGRFVAYQDSDCTRVSVSHGKVAIHRPGTGQLQWIEGGQNWRLDAQGAHRLAHMEMDAMAWTEVDRHSGHAPLQLPRAGQPLSPWLPGCSNEIATCACRGCSASKTRNNCFGCYRRRCPYDFVDVHAGGCM